MSASADVTTPLIRTATMRDVPGIARSLSRAFHDDPLMEWLFPDDATRMARTARMCAIIAGFGYVPRNGGKVAQAADDAVHGPVIRGAALWGAPGSAPEGAGFVLRSLPHWIPLVGPRKCVESARYFGALKEAAPAEPHWYLALLGADPLVRGRGTGTGLLRSGLVRADADRVPVHLETMNEDNVGYYERFGFRVTRRVGGPGRPTAYCMVRPAAA